MTARTTTLLDRLENKTLLRSAGFVAGEWLSDSNTGKTLEVKNPSTQEVTPSLPDMDVTETKAAIDAAFDAQKEWAARPGKERAAILRKWHDLMVAQADDLGAILTAERGKPPTVMTEVTRDMDLPQEEVFGPVAALFQFETVDDGIDDYLKMKYICMAV